MKPILKARSAETHLFDFFSVNLPGDMEGLDVTRNELWRAALQTSSPDIIHNFLKTTGSDGIFHRFCLRRSVRSGSEYFVFTPCGRSNEPGESLWQPWSTSQSSEHSEIPLPTELPHGFLCFVPKGSPNPPYLNWAFQTAAKFQGAP